MSACIPRMTEEALAELPPEEKESVIAREMATLDARADGETVVGGCDETVAATV